MSSSAQQTSNKQVHTGFTLVELLIVIGLISVMTGAVIPSFSNYLKSQNVRQAQEQVKSDLRSVSNKALTGTSSNVANVNYWGISFVGGQTNYTTFTTATNTHCLPSVGSPDFKLSSTTSSNLVGNVTIGGSNNLCVYYSLDNGDANFVGSFPVCTGSLTGGGLTCVNVCDGASCKQIGMNGAGLVRIGN